MRKHDTVTVSWAAQADTLRQIKTAVAGKIVVDTTVPLVPPKVMRVQLPPEGCAARADFTALRHTSLQRMRRSIATCWCSEMTRWHGPRVVQLAEAGGRAPAAATFQKFCAASGRTMISLTATESG